MSMELMVKAMKAKVGNPLRKLVLIKLADNASDQGECWPSYQHIAEQCEISKRSAMSHIDALCDAGFVIKQSRRGPKGNATNVYILNFDGANAAPPGAGDSLGSAGAAPPPSAGAAPGISHSFEPVKEPVNNPIRSTAKKPAANPARDEAFESAWALYPKREGSNPKNHALSSWKARLTEGHSAESMLAGLQRYLAYCQAKGSVGTAFVMQAKRFFGPGQEFLSDWAVSQAPTGRGESQQEYWERANADTSWADDLGI